MTPPINGNWSQRTDNHSDNRVDRLNIGDTTVDVVGDTGLSIDESEGHKTTGSIEQSWENFGKVDVCSVGSSSITGSLFGFNTEHLTLETSDSGSGHTDITNPGVSVPLVVTTRQPSDEISHGSGTHVDGGTSESGVKNRKWDTSSGETSTGGDITSTTDRQIVCQGGGVDLTNKDFKDWRQREQVTDETLNSLPDTSLDQFLDNDRNEGNEEDNKDGQGVTSDPVDGWGQVVTAVWLQDIGNWLISVVITNDGFVGQGVQVG
ncbi:hypothetical protein WICPIJ_008694 [Wickerhamomyces pijperi]|uniref:Uncharacterized protein n=1 Tax=Wickerhamomyces pijperi TaxID=599730 RepID=A0A9P8PX55_WICPI|nr:hypothetical protein WICPIJ_008694 [Wickerhamomyces pijperi]